MYPEILKIGHFSIRSYGLMLAVSFFLGIIYLGRMAKKENIDFGQVLTIAYILIIAGILGARFSYVLFHLDEFRGNWLSSINPFGSDHYGIAGLNLYGGIIAAFICSLIYLLIKKMPIFKVYDLIAPTVGLGLIFTRIGCFLNGCCFGTPTHLPWGISFPEGSLPYYVFGSQHLHPSQLYSSLYGLILFVYLHWQLKSKKFDGQVIAQMFMIEAVFRYLIEYVRYYESEMHVSFWGMNPTYNNLMSIFLFLLGLTLFLVRYFRYRSARRTTA
jgi:phosphatidylglycerol:prolipoprotein diacylglycerol transferase